MRGCAGARSGLWEALERLLWPLPGYSKTAGQEQTRKVWTWVWHTKLLAFDSALAGRCLERLWGELRFAGRSFGITLLGLLGDPHEQFWRFSKL